MDNEWLDVAYINLDEAILHGRVVDGRDVFGVTLEREVRVTLTDEQKTQIEDMNFKHQLEMRKLLKGFVS